MRLTSFTDYTIRTLIYLALRPDTLCTIDEIATSYGISVNHLTKVVQQAAQAGEVRTVRGQGGGLRLARPPEEINVGAILRRTEPDLNIVPCFGTGDSCPIQAACVLREMLGHALAAFLAVLDRVTLADLVRPSRRLSDLLRIEHAGQDRSVADLVSINANSDRPVRARLRGKESR
jgi:Rrf2 family nitric oxide-sensitive transcriptional repressor